MAVPVIMKSGKNYLTLILDAEMSFSELLQEIVVKFRESEKFFKKEPIAISFEGRNLSQTEQLQIIDALDCYTTVKVATIMDEDRIKEYVANDLLRKALYQDAASELEEMTEDAVCTFIPRNVRAGEHISSINTIVILGNVDRDAIVSSVEHIIVLGRLEGQAIAGFDGNLQSCILASEFLTEKIQIGELCCTLPKEKGFLKKGLNKRKTVGMRIAHVEEGAIQIDSFT